MGAEEFYKTTRQILGRIPETKQEEVNHAATRLRLIVEEYGDEGGAAALIVAAELIKLSDEGALTFISD